MDSLSVVLACVLECRGFSLSIVMYEKTSRKDLISPVPPCSVFFDFSKSNPLSSVLFRRESAVLVPIFGFQFGKFVV